MFLETQTPGKTETKANPFNLDALIAWLETMPAGQSYPFLNCRGECLDSQYVTYCGLGTDPDFYEDFVLREWANFHGGDMRAIAEEAPRTFGGALRRARAVRAARAL